MQLSRAGVRVLLEVVVNRPNWVQIHYRAESRYAPVEGEALAIVYALENTRHFNLGCTNLVVMTDHKPLCKLMGSKSMEEIINPRLPRLKESTMRWSFEVVQIPGSLNSGPDALSQQA